MASGSAERRGGWRPQALQDGQVDRASRSLRPPGCPPRAPTGGTERARLAKEKSRWWRVSAQHAAEGVGAAKGTAPPSAHTPGSHPPSHRGGPPPRRGNGELPGSFSQRWSLCPSDWPLEHPVTVRPSGELPHHRFLCEVRSEGEEGAPSGPADLAGSGTRGFLLLSAPAPQVLPLTGGPAFAPEGPSPRWSCLFDYWVFLVVFPVGRASAGP